MNIGMISTRLAGVDGVSLEAAKLAAVLRRQGHQVYYCAGELSDDAGAPPGRLVPVMHFSHPVIRELHDEAFGVAAEQPHLYRRLFDEADKIRGEMQAFVDQFSIDVLITQNVNAIPMNIPLGVALRDLVERTRIPTICHNHDFYWERERFLTNSIADLLDSAFPPALQPVRHLVISTPAQRRLYLRRGIPATYLPNVFDFAHPPAPPDDDANTFRAALGLDDGDIIALQATRIIRRKGIEKAIELIRKLGDERLILLITGYEGDEAGGYGAWLREEAESAGIRYRFIGDWVGDARSERDGHRVYHLWDIYPHATFMTYPSIIEGFGNAFVEAMYFRKPTVVHTYPIYKADIKPTGVRAVEFYYDIDDDVLAQTRRLIDDVAWRDDITAHNYAVGRRHFSYEVLEETLTRVLATF